MSNPFKAVGKVFKKVVKVVKKVALPVLAVGAVVLTGGAALGALPAIGSVLGSVGISGTLASVLGGAISAGAIGAVTGGIGAAVGGGDFFKGMTKGFTTGAIAGGVGGGLGLISPDGLLSDFGIGAKSATDVAVQAAGGVVPGATNGVTSIAPAASGVSSSSILASAAPGASVAATGAGSAIPAALSIPAAAAPAAAGGAAVAAAGGGGPGLLGTLAPTLVQTAGRMISGFSQGKMMEAQMEADQLAERDNYDRIAYNYGYRNRYSDGSNIPTATDRWHEYAPQDLTQQGGLLQRRAAARPYQIVNGKVVQV